MSEKVMSGRRAADNLLAQLRKQLEQRQCSARLGIIQVGNDPASESYIRQKKKAAEISGVVFDHYQLPDNSTFETIQKQILDLNRDPQTTAFMLQLPLDVAQPISKKKVSELLNGIAPEKDADGLHVINQGRLMSGESLASNWTSPIPATALGILRLLNEYRIGVQGLNAVVVGRSRLVGLPTAVLLTHEGATTTVAHRHTKNLKALCAQADLLVVAAGQKHLIREDFVSPKAIVIDVGIHVDEHGKLTGDVCPKALKKCAKYSPVPGGVGPMTVAGLIENTVRISLSPTGHP